MIDLFTLALTHGLIVLALWRLLFRSELDVEDPPVRGAKRWGKEAQSVADQGLGDA